MFSHAAGAASAMEASLVKVTVKGLAVALQAATVSGVVNVCELPLVPEA